MTNVSAEVPRHELDKLRQCWNQVERKFDARNADNAVRRILNKTMTPVLEKSRALAPVDTGLLKRSIVKRTGRDKDGLFAIVYVSRSRGERLIAAGRSQELGRSGRVFASWYQVIAVEYGNRNVKERKFLRGGMERGRANALHILEQEIGAEIDKLATITYNTIGKRGR